MRRIAAAKVDNKSIDEWSRYNNDFFVKHKDFYENTALKFLADNDSENTIYSPALLYIALGFLAFICEHNSRQEILNLLGDDSIIEVKDNIKLLFDFLTIDEEEYVTSLSNSIWLSKGIIFKENTVKELNGELYTSLFEGEMGSDELNLLFRKYINDNTNNLLKTQTDGLELDESTIISLVSTIYYKVCWRKQFDEENSFEAPFDSGKEKALYMKNTENMDYFIATNFVAIKLPTLNGYSCYILPNEQVPIEDVLKNDELYYLLTDNVAINSRFAKVNYSIPKYDAIAKNDLINILMELGIKEVFYRGDFGNITDDRNLYVSSMIQGTRIITDEKGIEAASFVEIMISRCAILEPDKIYDFICDRPFINIITEFNIPVFTSVIRKPKGV